MLAWIHRGEEILLSFLLLLTLGVAAGQIIMRNLLDTSIVWADTLVRVLVLWIAMLGAVIATRENKHIRIDLLSRYLSSFRRTAADGIVSLLAGGICALAAYWSLVFVIGEYQAGEAAFAGVPVWLCAAILPVSLAIMALRFCIQGAMDLNQLKGPGPS